jgi:hypothetical protein
MAVEDHENAMGKSTPQEPLGKVKIGKQGIYDYTGVLKSTYRDLKIFLQRPVPRGVVCRCYIERSRSGLNSFSPFYSLCADLDDGTGRELIVCRKLFKSQSAHYVFSLKSDDLWREREQRSRLFLGKLRKLDSGEYVLYDHGIHSLPTDEKDKDTKDFKQSAADLSESNMNNSKTNESTSTSDKNDESSLYRKELMVCYFSSKSRPTPTYGMEICIPNPTNMPKAEGELLNKVGSKISMIKPFKEIRDSCAHNDLYSQNLFIMNEKQSRFYILYFIFLYVFFSLYG